LPGRPGDQEPVPWHVERVDRTPVRLIDVVLAELGVDQPQTPLVLIPDLGQLMVDPHVREEVARKSNPRPRRHLPGARHRQEQDGEVTTAADESLVRPP
jgi:hypothetical protein